MRALDPALWFFLLGVIAAAARSPFRLPTGLGEVLGAYLLISIGIKGGAGLLAYSPGAITLQLAGVLLVGVLTPIVTFYAARAIAKLERLDAATFAAHFGSTSVMTFAVATAFLTANDVAFESHIPLYVVVLEIPGILIGIAFARARTPGHASSGWTIAQELFLGKSVLLLIGGLVIGATVDANGLARIEPVFLAAFPGVLCLYLLDLGATAVDEAGALKKHLPGLIALGTLVPLAFGLFGARIGALVGLSVGGATLLATLAASASYIAAPAAMRVACPEANVGMALATALCIVFPMNVFIGIPLYLAAARWIVG